MLTRSLGVALGVAVFTVGTVAPAIGSARIEDSPQAAPLTTVQVPRVRLVQPPTVLPDGGSATAPASSTGLKLTFSVYNPSTNDEWMDYGCVPTGKIVGCEVDWDGFISANATLNVDVIYDTGTAGSGVLELQVGWAGPDAGWYNVTVQ